MYTMLEVQYHHEIYGGFSSSRCPFWAIDATLYVNLLIYMF